MSNDETKIELLSSTTGMFFVLWFVDANSAGPVSLVKQLGCVAVGLVAGYLVAKSGLLDS